MLRARRQIALLVVLLLLGVAPPSAGAPGRRAGKTSARAASEQKERLRLSRRLFRTAEACYRVGDVERALQLYREAHQLMPLPGFLFNIAQCYRRLGEWSNALTYYDAFMAAVPEAPNREQVQELIALCRKQISGRQPTTTVRRSGGRPRSLRTLVKASKPEPAVPPRHLVSMVEPATPAASTDRLASFRPADRPVPPSLRPWIFGVAALGGALAVTGTVTGALALADGDAYGRPGLTAQQRADLKQHGEAMKVTSTVTFTLAGAAALTAVVLYLVDRSERTQRTRFGLAPFAGGGAVVLARRF